MKEETKNLKRKAEEHEQKIERVGKTVALVDKAVSLTLNSFRLFIGFMSLKYLVK